MSPLPKTMNFKTTLVLIVLLAVAAVALFFTRDKGGETQIADSGDGRKLLDVDRDDVTKVTVAPAIGDKFTLEKSGGEWRLTEPVSAPVESFEVDSLLRALVDATSRGALEGEDAASSATGLSTPAYRVELLADGKTHTLNVGAKSAVGGNVYVSIGEGGNEVHVTDVALTDQLEKPPGDYRKTQLVDIPSAQVKQLSVTDAAGKVIVRAAKQGEEWQVVEPVKMPAERSEIDDMIFAATGLRAIEFVSESPADAPRYQLDKPQLTVTLSTDPPATQPATAPATQRADAATMIAFGRHDDVRKQNVYATVSGSPSIAKVAATALENFNKKPIELRDKRAVDIDPEQVSRLSFTADLAATTQPTSRPASHREVVIQRRTEAAPLGPAAPTTAPATTTTGPASTAPATTQAATQPGEDVAKWELVSGPGGEASDQKVEAILRALDPLRVQRYLEAVPATQAAPIGTYTLNVTTELAGGANPVQHQLRLADRGNDQPLIGEYNGLVFELDRSILRQLEGEFTKGAAPATPPGPAGGNEPNLPFPLGQ
ncbi:MAG TPA: DUF4340 domain-containing protein [Tepidisphaeraceae bacterium]|nr:DUF4340 domain-containing protein [Tepidisphaeraceae bacterium]